MFDQNSSFISIRNRRGVLIFLAIALGFVFVPRILMSLKSDEKIVLTAEEIEELRTESFKEQKKFDQRYKKKERRSYKRPHTRFDPNQYTKADWMKLGLSEKQTNVVLSFTKRGIRSNEELSSIFVIPEELYDMIKDSTFYLEQPKIENRKSVGAKPQKTIRISINTADQTELETIPGVGPFYAKNILKYRERLGGFVRKEQLLEVWKMDVEKYNGIEQFIVVEPENIKRIELNTTSAEEMKSHPYLNWNIANSLIKIRNKKGRYSVIEEIKESVLIDEELFEKIKPYLSL
jgi:competence ComEA-like helix-hairpin-helix protein